MLGNRIYGFDSGKGLAIMGMLLAHTFEGGICDWNLTIESSYIKKVPIWLIVLLSPIAIICVMGLFFTIITSVTCSMSIMRAEEKGKKAVYSYLIYRAAFGFVLIGVEYFFKSWWKYYGWLDQLVIQLPIAKIDTDGDTLDSIAFCGFLVPLSVHLVRRLPCAKKAWSQVFILATAAILLLMSYFYIATWSMMAADACFRHKFNLIGLLFSKIGSGNFMIAQSFPFGLCGGCMAIILHETKEWRQLWKFCWALMSVAVAIGVFFLLTTKDIIKSASADFKPCSIRFLELSFEIFFLTFVCGYSDDDTRPVAQRYTVIKNMTFLRRINVVSLSCYIFEMWVSKMVMKFFLLFAGPAYDAEKEEGLWNLWTLAAYMAINFTLDLYIIKGWELFNFRFSCEHIIGVILNFLFNKQESIIYAPNKEMECLIKLQTAEKKEEASASEGEVNIEMQQQEPQVPVKDQEVQVLSTLISLKNDKGIE